MIQERRIMPGITDERGVILRTVIPKERLIKKPSHPYSEGLQMTLADVNAHQGDKIEQIMDVHWEALRAGAKIFTVGNGGASTVAEHIWDDLGRYAAIYSEKYGMPILPIFNISSSVDGVTAMVNDYGAEQAFMSQYNMLGPYVGDIVIAVSGSGESPNLLTVFTHAKQHGLSTVSFTGRNPENSLAKLSDIAIVVPSTHYEKYAAASLDPKALGNCVTAVTQDVAAAVMVHEVYLNYLENQIATRTMLVDSAQRNQQP